MTIRGARTRFGRFCVVASTLAASSASSRVVHAGVAIDRRRQPEQSAHGDAAISIQPRESVPGAPGPRRAVCLGAAGGGVREESLVRQPLVGGGDHARWGTGLPPRPGVVRCRRAEWIHPHRDGPIRPADSLRVEAVQDTITVPAAMEIYVEGSALNDPAQRRIRKPWTATWLRTKTGGGACAGGVRIVRKGALTNLRGDGADDRGGDFRITRVVDDRVQTFVSIPNARPRRHSVRRQDWTRRSW